MRLTLSFYECEHFSDLDNYMDDIRACGGSINSYDVNADAEIGWVDFTVEDKEEFYEQFKETEAYDFVD